MKRSLVALVLALVLFGAPTLSACERCLNPGQADSVGNVSNKSKCETGYTEGFSSCSTPFDTGCFTGTDSVCKGKTRGTPWVRYGVVPAEPADCSTDLSGSCSGPKTQMESFLG